jgi:hypothetical protein
MSENPKSGIEQLADQLVESWPDAWFAPMNYSAISHVHEIKTTLGSGMILYGEEQSAIHALIDLLGKEQFIAQIGDLVFSARDRRNINYVSRQEKAAREAAEIEMRRLAERQKLRSQEIAEQLKEFAFYTSASSENYGSKSLSCLHAYEPRKAWLY